MRLTCIPESGLHGFTDEVLDLDHQTYAKECAIDIPGPEIDELGRLTQQLSMLSLGTPFGESARPGRSGLIRMCESHTSGRR